MALCVAVWFSEDWGQDNYGWQIPNTQYYVDNRIDQLHDSQKNGDEGRMGENIPNT